MLEDPKLQLKYFSLYFMKTFKQTKDLTFKSLGWKITVLKSRSGLWDKHNIESWIMKKSFYCRGVFHLFQNFDWILY
jgi:hypothetical protein